MKYRILRSLYHRALQTAGPRFKPSPCRAGLLGVAAIVAVAFSTGADVPFAGNSSQTVTITGSSYQSGVVANIAPPTATAEPEPTPEATPEAAAPVEALGPQPAFVVDSSAVAIWEAGCGKMLYTKNADTRLAPASLTKMMTLLVSLDDRAHPMNILRPGIDAAELKQRTRSSVMGLRPDSQVTMQDLYMGLMLPSGNDAAIALANASGDYDGFVGRMNERAAQMGLTNTHFTNPHGLDNPELYSTARDLLVLERVMMEHPYAKWVVGTPYYTTTYGTLGFNNGNKLLTNYRGTIGGKTGFTNAAGHTLAVSVVRDGRRLDMTVLGSAVKFEEPMRLLDWAFNETKPAC